MLISVRHQQYKMGCTIDAILVSHRTPERALAPILESFSRVWEDKLGKVCQGLWEHVALPLACEIVT